MSYAMLVELISLLDPASFGRSQRLAELSERVTVEMGMGNAWSLGIAAVISQIGVPTIPHSVVESIETKNSWMVIPAGTVLRASHLEKLKNFALLTGLKEPITVMRP